ncbi:MAG TPA: hypothetical protein VH459_03625 [Gaiellales bacterium]|jgi:hypothetical protein
MSLRAFFLSMRAVRLDDETADRMLAGDVDPADAPPGYAAVAELLETARAAAGMPVPAASTARRPSDLGVTQATSTRRTVRRSRSGRRRIPVLAAVAFCAMTGGAYAAGATGAGSATVSAVLDRIGMGSLVGSPSGGHGHAASGTAALKGEASATTGAAAAAPVGAGHDTSGDDAGTGKTNGKGKDISKLARTTDAKGVDKGAQISTAASGGKSHAGQHGNAHGTHPSHPAHPSHPDHPSKPDHPQHPSHPSHPDHPSGGGGGGGS